MEIVEIKSVIESLLFVSSKPLKVKELSKILEQENFKIQNALDELVAERKEAGVVVLENNGEYQLATNSKNSPAVKSFLNADLREKLTDATLEVLAIITYRQPISKAEIEAIRGVNSQYSLRHLLMRGLIEKIPNPDDARSVIYQTTTEFLQHMGLVSLKDLPAYEDLVGQIKLPESPALQASTPEITESTPGTEETAPNTQSPELPDKETASHPLSETDPAETSPVPPETEELEKDNEEDGDEDEDDEEEDEQENT